jgi:hypothetical protein
LDGDCQIATQKIGMVDRLHKIAKFAMMAMFIMQQVQRK